MPDSNATNLMSLPTVSLREKFEEVSAQAEEGFSKKHRILLRAFSDVVKRLQDIGISIALDTSDFRSRASVTMTIGTLAYKIDVAEEYMTCGDSYPTKGYALTAILHTHNLNQSREFLLKNIMEIAANYEVSQKAMDDFAVPAKPKPLDDRRKVSLNKPKAS